MRARSTRATRRLCAAAVVGAVAGAAALASGAMAAGAPTLNENGGSAAKQIRGTVNAGGAALRNASVDLYWARARGRAVRLGRAQTNRSGRFAIGYRRPGGSDAVLYLVTEGGITRSGRRPDSFTLAAVFGAGAAPSSVRINERTTAGSAFGMAQFLKGKNIAGPAPGMPRAADMVGHLADVRTGTLGFSVRTYATKQRTTPKTLNSLANMLAACSTNRSACSRLLNLATPQRKRSANNTFEAIAMIADYPSNSVRPLFNLSQTGTRPYRPALGSAPTAWTVALRLMGPTTRAPNGDKVSSELNGPGLIAFDRDGDAWISNNYEPQPNPLIPVCAGKSVFELDPTVTGRAVLNRSLSEYNARQLWGAGFGIAVDPKNRVWVGNFGFQGGDFGARGCTEPPQPPPAESVSLFGPKGKALSPTVAQNPISGGFTEGDFEGPQGMLSDRRGNLWIAACGNRKVVLYPAGDPSRAVSVAPDGLQQPFGLWLDGDRNAWVTSNQTGQVYAFGPDGGVLPGSPFGQPGELNRSMGITVDSAGNKWISNSTWVNAPCEDWKSNAFENIERGFVTLLETDGPRAELTQFRANSLVNPWGIAADGEDHIFVANFGGNRIAELCGAKTGTCPSGHKTGDAIGKNGYPYNGLTRVTGISVDNSGHVWAVNNWINKLIQSNPGGKAVVVYFGLAEPVQTPAYGPPRRVLG